jgi:hypothetical protein
LRYVDAGYAICLGALALYAAGLAFRRRRLERAATVLDGPDHGRVGAVAASERDGDGGPPHVAPPVTGGDR